MKSLQKQTFSTPRDKSAPLLISMMFIIGGFLVVNLFITSIVIDITIITLSATLLFLGIKRYIKDREDRDWQKRWR